MQNAAFNRQFATATEVFYHPGFICVNRRTPQGGIKMNSSAVKIDFLSSLQVLKK